MNRRTTSIKKQKHQNHFFTCPHPSHKLNSITPIPSVAVSINPTIVKKLNHNASERDHSKKINILYSSLRSLLPATDQAKKLSIPSTANGKNDKKKGTLGSSISKVSTSRLSDKEVVVQISTFKVHESPLSEVLLNLKEDGLLVINASSFESFGGRVFYNLHLQVEGTQRMECEVLSEKLQSLCDKRGEAFP